jgi:hypothetical protein
MAPLNTLENLMSHTRPRPRHAALAMVSSAAAHADLLALRVMHDSGMERWPGTRSLGHPASTEPPHVLLAFNAIIFSSPSLPHASAVC